MGNSLFRVSQTLQQTGLHEQASAALGRDRTSNTLSYGCQPRKSHLLQLEFQNLQSFPDSFSPNWCRILSRTRWHKPCRSCADDGCCGEFSQHPDKVRKRFLFFYLCILYWSITDSQCCDSFRCTAKGLQLFLMLNFSHGFCKTQKGLFSYSSRV